MTFRTTRCLKFGCFFISLFLIFAFFGTSCKVQSSAPYKKDFFGYFDTLCQVSSYKKGETREEFSENCRFIEGEIQKYHEMMDIYREYGKMVNLKTINREAGKKPLPVGEELFSFLQYCKELYYKTGGKMNIAMGSVIKLWKTAEKEAEENPKNAKIPTKSALLEASHHVDIENLVLKSENRTVFLKDENMSLDVGAMGKGYAAEQIKNALLERGATSYLLNFGGTVVAVGSKNQDTPFTVGILNPNREEGGFSKRIFLENASAVTSGSYERCFTLEGQNFHHIIDVKTLFPSKYFKSVTVVSENAAVGDALSTALFCMSVEEGRTLLSKFENVEVYYITNEDEEYFLGAFEHRIL